MLVNKIYSKIYNIIMQKPCLRVLKKYGLRFGKNFSVQKGCIIDNSHCYLISIGDNVTLAHNVHILAHDASTKMFLGKTKIGKVCIGNNVFVGADTVILPNVIIGNRVIIGANSVVTKKLDGNGVYAGNPAKKIMDLDQYLQKYNNITTKTFDEKYRLANNPSKKMIKEINEEVDNFKIAFIK